MLVLNYKFGLFAPLGWDDICEREIKLQTALWNRLVELELAYRAAVERTIRQDDEYRRRAEEIEAISTEIDGLVAERASQRKAARAKIPTPELDARITELIGKRRQMWAEIKTPRRNAFKAYKEELGELGDRRFRDIADARRGSGLWWANYNAVLASFDATLRRLKLGQNPRPIDGERESGRLSIQIQHGVPVPSFLAGGKREARLDMDEAQWSRRGRHNWVTRRGVLHATVRSDGRDSRKMASWPMKVHRPLPPGAIIKSMTIVRRHPVPSTKEWKWEAVFTLSMPDPETSVASGACGIDLGWRKVEAGLRVATIAYGNGGIEHILLPADMLERRVRVAELAGLIVKRNRDRDRDPKRDPEWQRYTLEIARWNRRRREIYRVVAAQLVRTNGLIGLDAAGIAEMAQDKTTQPPETRRMRTWAAPTELAAAIKDAARKEGVRLREVAGPSTLTCHHCGHRNNVSDADRMMLIWRCAKCKALWDQDENAARNCLGVVLDKSAAEAVTEASEPERKRPPRLTRKRQPPQSEAAE